MNIQPVGPTNAVTSLTSASAPKATTAQSADDGVSVSSFGQFLMKMQDMASTDPAKAKEILGSIANRLKAESAQVGGTRGPRLAALGERFQMAADSGDLSGLQSAQRTAVGGHSAHQRAQAAYSPQQLPGQGETMLFALASLVNESQK